MSSKKESWSKGVKTTTRSDNNGTRTTTRQAYTDTWAGKVYGRVISRETRKGK